MLLGHWKEHYLLSFYRNKKHDGEFHQIYALTPPLGMMKSTFFTMNLEGKVATFGTHFLGSVSPVGEVSIWNLSTPRDNWPSTVTLDPYYKHSEASSANFECCASSDHTLCVVFNDTLFQVCPPTSRSGPTAKPIAKLAPGLLIRSLDIIRGPSGNPRVAMLVQNGDGKTVLFLGSFPKRQDQCLDDVGDWLPLSADYTQVKIVGDHLLLSDKTIDVVKVSYIPTLHLEKTATISHGISGLKDTAGYLPSFVPSLLKSAVAQATSYFQKPCDRLYGFL